MHYIATTLLDLLKYKKVRIDRKLVFILRPELGLDICQKFLLFSINHELGVTSHCRGLHR